MAHWMDFLTVISCMFLTCDGFYKPKSYKTIATYTPQTLDELKDLLCSKKKILFIEGGCDNEPKKIIINKVFDFTNSEGTKVEAGCSYNSFDSLSSCPNGMKILKTAGGCVNKPVVSVEYSVAGLQGLEVGSNKIIVGIYGGGLKGKGLKLVKSSNVQIRNLVFTDINPHLYNGGSAIELIGVSNVLIDGNYFKNIGHAMVGSFGGTSTGVSISKNFFDGNTLYSLYCDGRHNYVWWFAGEDERIRLEHNTVHHASRALTVGAQKVSKSVVHLVGNVLYDIKPTGAIQVTDKESSVLVEGNVFADVTAITLGDNRSNVFVAQTETDEAACEQYINRKCDVNTLVRVEGGPHENNMQALRDIKVIFDAKAWFNWWFGERI